MRTLSLVGVAVAAALATGAAEAAGPTLATIQAAITGNTAKQFWISGSSAAKNGLLAFVQANVCGGAANTSVFTSASPVSNPDFNAWACTATAGPTNGSLTVIYYRAEGGSAVGVLPIFNNKAINQMDLSAANTTCPNTAGGNCVIAGTQPVNGPNDSWGPAGVEKTHKPDLGISDHPPTAFQGHNSVYANAPPFGYTPGTWGAQPTNAQLVAMDSTVLFQQTFEIVANTNLGAGNVNALSSQAVANILQGNYINWNAVPAFGSASPGAAVLAASTPIFVCNREVGSGTRTGADIYFNGSGCTVGAPTISEGPANQDNFATSDELSCVNNNGAGHGAPAGSIAIGYVSVDNNSKIGAGNTFPNVQAMNLDGVVPSNFATASGQYSWAYEATAQPNAASGNPVEAALATFFITNLQALATAPQSSQINVIPGVSPGGALNTAQIPLQVNGKIFTTDFFRGGNSCNVLSEQN